MQVRSQLKTPFHRRKFDHVPLHGGQTVAGKQKSPERETVRRATWLKVIEKLNAERLVIGGKSMGGRIASLVADEAEVAGLVCLGYPFHPVGKPDKLRVEHLLTIKTPTLIVQGERDSSEIEMKWPTTGFPPPFSCHGWWTAPTASSRERRQDARGSRTGMRRLRRSSLSAKSARLFSVKTIGRTLSSHQIRSFCDVDTSYSALSNLVPERPRRHGSHATAASFSTTQSRTPATMTSFSPLCARMHRRVLHGKFDAWVDEAETSLSKESGESSFLGPNGE